MPNLQKYLMRALIAFAPTVLFFVGAASGLIEYEGREFDAASNVAALIQAIVFIPFIVWMWVDFRRHPEKYPAPGWLLRAIDLLLLGFFVLVFAYIYFD